MSKVLNMGDVVEMGLWWYYNNQVGLTTYHYLVNSVTGGGGMTDADFAFEAEALTGGGGQYSDQCRDIVGPDADYRGNSAQLVYPTRYVMEQDISGAGIGTDIGAQLPSQVSGLVSKYGAEANRRNRGRNYYPFPSTNSLFGGTADGPGPIYVAKLLSISEKLRNMTVLDTGGGAGVTLLPIIFNALSPVTSIVIVRSLQRKFWATQRRRGDFGRTNLPPF